MPDEHIKYVLERRLDAVSRVIDNAGVEDSFAVSSPDQSAVDEVRLIVSDRTQKTLLLATLCIFA